MIYLGTNDINVNVNLFGFVTVLMVFCEIEAIGTLTRLYITKNNEFYQQNFIKTTFLKYSNCMLSDTSGEDVFCLGYRLSDNKG